MKRKPENLLRCYLIESLDQLHEFVTVLKLGMLWSPKRTTVKSIRNTLWWKDHLSYHSCRQRQRLYIWICRKNTLFIWVQNASIDPSELLLVPENQLLKKSLEKLLMPTAACQEDDKEIKRTRPLQHLPIPHQSGWHRKQQTPQKSIWPLTVFLRPDLFHHHLGDCETVSHMHEPETI